MSLVDKVTTRHTILYIRIYRIYTTNTSVILNVAFVAETFTAGFMLETFAALNSVAAIASLLALLNITQFVDQFKMKDTSQLNNGMSKFLQKLLKCFNATAISTFYLFALFSSSISPSAPITLDL